MTSLVSRRFFLQTLTMGAATTGLSACMPAGLKDIALAPVKTPPASVNTPLNNALAPFASMYGEMRDGDFVLPAIPYQHIDPQFLRQIVDDPTGEQPGTIVVDTKRRYLYLVRLNGKAIRYGVSVGKEGFAWSGRGIIEYKRKWPTWTPPADMIARQPQLAKYSAANGGMKPGLKNPLGARALYIFQDGKDTLYRLHGSPDWSSIGKRASSGCVRLINQDIIDLYERVPEKAPVLVV
ncbi:MULTISPECIES: L,D-transpeptidase [Bartonella]|uniref:L,D-transpeptidase n=1 Tax=Bartonella TaxID=773 RepID=UPI0018DBC992|nr:MULTISPECIES: L,D-transpeptidase [Bartonella]MBH9974115.1 L,D-transpeptidase [Bartonella choladocola]MBI0013722.1 L,D-transpeptidase [Bartonella sp. B10834G3]